jgi:hypothetical protein
MIPKSAKALMRLSEKKLKYLKNPSRPKLTKRLIIRNCFPFLENCCFLSDYHKNKQPMN